MQAFSKNNWLHKVIFTVPDPAKADKFQLTIGLGAVVPDGFGGTMQTFKDISLADLAEQGIELPQIAGIINGATQMALANAETERDKLRVEIAELKEASRAELVDMQADLDGKTDDLNTLRHETAAKTAQLQDLVASQSQEIAALKADMANRHEHYGQQLAAVQAAADAHAKRADAMMRSH